MLHVCRMKTCRCNMSTDVIAEPADADIRDAAIKHRRSAARLLFCGWGRSRSGPTAGHSAPPGSCRGAGCCSRRPAASASATARRARRRCPSATRAATGRQSKTCVGGCCFCHRQQTCCRCMLMIWRRHGMRVRLGQLGSSLTVSCVCVRSRSAQLGSHHDKR